MKSVVGLIFIAIFSLGFIACSQNVTIRNSQSDMISGSIGGVGASALGKSSQTILASCNQPDVFLHRLTEQGEVGELVSQTTIDAERKFLFTLLGSKGAVVSNVSTSTPSYVLRFLCDDEVLSRFVTGSAGQDIDFATTMLSWFSQTSVSQKVMAVPLFKWNELYNSLAGANSVEQVFDKITNNSQVRSQVEEAGLLPSELNDASPVIRNLMMPTVLSEQVPNVLNALVHHWNPTYDFAYEWRLNGQLLATTASYNYVPGSNSQGDYTLQLFVGKNDGTGRVDTASPYVNKVIDAKVANTVLPVAPVVTLLSSSLTNSTSVQIRLSTGAVAGDTFTHCRSFSQFAIVEDSAFSVALPPTFFSDFSHSCTTATAQDMTVTLSGTPGPRVLRVWAMDAVGTVSVSPSQVFLEYDIAAPQLAITNPVAGFAAQNGLTVSGTCESGLPVQITGTGVTGTTATCTAGVFSSALSFSAGDGVKAVQISQTDLAGNSATDARSFIRDTLAPVVAITSPAANTRTQNDITISGTCEAGVAVQVNGTGAVPVTTDCTSGTFSQVVSYSLGDGTKTFQVTQTDAAGNPGSASRNFIRDTAPPVLTITAPAAMTVSQNTINLSGACETGLTVTIAGSGTTGGTASCTASSYSSSVSLSNVDGVKNITVSQSDVAGNTTTVARDFLRDTTAPTLTYMQINTGETGTGNRNVVLAVQGISDRSDIFAVCIKMNDSAPPIGADPCWNTLSSLALSVTDALVLSNFPFQVGSLLGTYTLRVWLKDQIGNISMNGDVNGTDRSVIEYQPDPPPVISNFTVTSSDVVSSPLTESDVLTPMASDIYVKWNITDNNSIGAGKITLHYTTDEVNYTVLQAGLNNGANGGCTVDAGTTGCARLSGASPLSTYYKVRLSVEDTGSFTSLSTSNPVNTGKFTVLSGNTSLGIGGSASSAILLGRNESNSTIDTAAFVVTRKGDIFFNYNTKGLAHISPTTGIVTILALDTNASSGDGGPVVNATFNQIGRLILDYQDNLLIFDNDRVRKVDLADASWPITTLFGGGGSSVSGAPALSANLWAINNQRIFTVLPNGRIYVEKDRELWYYDPVDSTVKLQMTLTGMGLGAMTGNLPTFDWSVCASSNTTITFDKTTSTVTKILRRGHQSPSASCTSHSFNEPSRNANFSLATGIATAPHPPTTSWSSVNFTGMDGRFYSIDAWRTQLLRYDGATNTVAPILGTGQLGRCADDTLATACAVNVTSAFINEFGRVYFLDLGVIRMIDDTGRVKTVAGQARNFGVGENPGSARYGLINFFDVVGNDVYVNNKNENQITKFSLAGGNVVRIAGNGVVGSPAHNELAVGQPLNNGGWDMPVGFRVDASQQRLYYRGVDTFSYIDLVTGRWNVSGTTIQHGNARASYLALAPDRALAYVQTHHGFSGNNSNLREVNLSTGAAPVVYGQDSVLTSLGSDLCDGAVGTTCLLQATLNNFTVQTRAKYDSTLNSWIVGFYNRNYINILPLGGGTTSRLEVMARPIFAFDTAYAGPDMMIYYCGNDGRLYKRNATTNVEAELPLPSTTIRCDGQSVHYHAGRNSVIFIYKQNDMYGIAEYANP